MSLRFDLQLLLCAALSVVAAGTIYLLPILIGWLCSSARVIHRTEAGCVNGRAALEIPRFRCDRCGLGLVLVDWHVVSIPGHSIQLCLDTAPADSNGCTCRGWEVTPANAEARELASLLPILRNDLLLLDAFGPDEREMPTA